MITEDKLLFKMFLISNKNNIFIFMLNYYLRKFLIFALIVCLASINQSCNKKLINDNSLYDFNNDLLYASFNGGIRSYDVEKNKEYVITSGKDYYPTYIQSKLQIYFLRFVEIPATKKDGPKLDSYVYAFDIKNKKERRLSKIKYFSPSRDLKDNVYFVEEGKYLICAGYSRNNIVIDTSNGEIVDKSIIEFMPQINNYSEDGEKIYFRVRQYPRSEIIENTEYLNTTETTEGIYSIDNNFNINNIFKLSEDEIFNRSIYGFTYSQSLDLLVLSIEKKIYIVDDNGNKKELIDGIHPSFFKKKILDNQILSFPLINLKFLYQVEYEKDDKFIFFAAKNYLSFINIAKREFNIFDSSFFPLAAKKKNDKYHIFDNISFLASFKFDKSLLLISCKDVNPSATPDNPLEAFESIELIEIFSVFNGKNKLLELHGGVNNIIQFRDLNLDGNNEIIYQYSASDFKCENKLKSAGRAVIWKDVYIKTEKGSYDVSDDLFPEIYKELLTVLEPLYSNALAALRLKQPILCDLDVEKLGQLIRDAKAIVYNK